MPEEKGPDFVIKDKRRFDEEGEPVAEKEEPREQTPEEPQAASDKEEASRAEADKAAGSAKAGTPLPELNFATLIFSLSSSALVHLGQVPDPGTGEPKPDLPLAKQTIDLLGLLKEKTRGNLEEDEDKLLEGVLYDLRMAYVQAVKAG